MALEFKWDASNLDHIARHQVTAFNGEYALAHPTLDIEYQDGHEEERFAEVGATESGRFLLIITTWRGHRIRVVTAYDASQALAEEYLRTR